MTAAALAFGDAHAAIGLVEVVVLLLLFCVACREYRNSRELATIDDVWTRDSFYANRITGQAVATTMMTVRRRRRTTAGRTDGCIIIHGTRIYTECELLWMMCQLIFYRPFLWRGGMEGEEKGAIDI